MINAARSRFKGDSKVEIRHHDLNDLLPAERFDAVVSSFAIHHCANERKRSLYAEIFERLEAGGVFCNLEHVSSPTDSLHLRFLTSMGMSVGEEDASNILLDVQAQLEWLVQIGYDDVDCYWKWLELALFGGVRR
jgi:SAM-dependent methyltransferase